MSSTKLTYLTACMQAALNHYLLLLLIICSEPVSVLCKVIYVKVCTHAQLAAVLCKCSYIGYNAIFSLLTYNSISSWHSFILFVFIRS